MDVYDKKKRSEIMARVKGRDTEPELLVRSIVHNLGYRFRLYRRDLPGNPDITLPRHRKVIFVHGCFWHGHKNCPRAARPTTNISFWKKKLDSNMARDLLNIRQLRKEGWRVLVIWQCQTKDMQRLVKRIDEFLES
ncbi:MAG: very short patch repair endonuclease [Nitrospirae bacterium]|nr:very short patch repair endonuclease [Nitrospirota bacterium]